MLRLHETCTVNGCDRPHKARGLCQTHYMQFKRGAPITETIKSRVRDKPPECVEDGCSNPVKANGLCATHYQRKLRRGFTTYPDRKRPPKPCKVEGCEDILYAKGLCHAHYLRRKTMKSYGTDETEFFRLHKQQGGLCLICEQPERSVNGLSGKTKALAVDHCHTSGAVRGLLCSSCNIGLGLFQDSPELLLNAAQYLLRHKT